MEYSYNKHPSLKDDIKLPKAKKYIFCVKKENNKTTGKGLIYDAREIIDLFRGVIIVAAVGIKGTTPRQGFIVLYGAPCSDSSCCKLNYLIVRCEM